jgi:hypothetical protein
MDTQNVVEQLSEVQLKKLGLVVGEGTYTIRESLLIAMPPPHPSETPSQTPNPLDTSKKPPTTGTRLSLAIVGPKGVALAQQFKEQLILSTRPPTPETDTSPDASADQSQAESNNTSQKDTFSFDESSYQETPAFGSDNPALIPHVSLKEAREAAAQKKKKPKNSMIKTNSSFVSRVYPADSLGKKLSERDPNGIFAFANINRAFHWMDLSTIQKTKVCQYVWHR